MLRIGLRCAFLTTGSALALIAGMAGSARAACDFNNQAGGVTNNAAHNCISYNSGTVNTGDVTNNSTLTATHAYPPGPPGGTSTGIQVFGLGTTLNGNIVNNGSISAPQYGISIGAGATSGTTQ